MWDQTNFKTIHVKLFSDIHWETKEQYGVVVVLFFSFSFISLLFPNIKHNCAYTIDKSLPILSLSFDQILEYPQLSLNGKSFILSLKLFKVNYSLKQLFQIHTLLYYYCHILVNCGRKFTLCLFLFSFTVWPSPYCIIM